MSQALTRVPFVYMTITPGGGNAIRNKKLLLIGYANPATKPLTTVDNELYLINQDEDILFGRSSQLSRMVKMARLNAPEPPPNVESVLQLKEAPIANTVRYDSLRGDAMEELSHA